MLARVFDRFRGEMPTGADHVGQDDIGDIGSAVPTRGCVFIISYEIIENGFQLIRIRYDQFDNIEDILNSTFGD